MLCKYIIMILMLKQKYYVIQMEELSTTDCKFPVS